MSLEINLSLINKIIIIQSIFLVMIFSCSALLKLVGNIRGKLNQRLGNIWRKKLVKHLIESKPINVPDSFSFQCFLVEYAQSFKGKYRYKLEELYLSKNFLNVDKRHLRSYSRQRRLCALRRIDVMNIVLPLEFMEELITHHDLFFSSAVLMNMIKTHRTKSAPYIFSFFHRHREYSKGILINLLKQYGLIDPEGLKFLLERVEDEYFQEALLTAIYYSPVEDIDEIIFKVVKNNSPLENKIMSLKVLDQYKTDRTLKLMKIINRQKG